MARRKVNFSHRKQRSVLTDMLPFEVPPSFSNKGFYAFLKRHQVELDAKGISWVANDGTADSAVLFLLGLPKATVVSCVEERRWGATVKTRRAEFKDARPFVTTPFHFVVSHKSDGRQLSVVHPRNQIKVAAFFARYFASITYFCSRSEFSIRRPVSVSRFTYYKDKLHQQTLDTASFGVEQEDREYEQLGSYFVYRRFRNIHQFFESADYHRCEKRFERMVQVDVTKCFDSIYTHSMSWALVGKAHAKQNLNAKHGAFFDEFDTLMQGLNYNETNGIVVGPEFSRVFAELILQSIDVEICRRLSTNEKLEHQKDYEIFRYVDDYFIFYDKETDWERILNALQVELRAMKLSINASKIKHYHRPILTELTMAKDRVSTLLNDAITSSIDTAYEEDGASVKARTLRCSINVSHLIIQFKTIIKMTGIEYGDVLNYALAIIENKTDRLVSSFSRSDRTPADYRTLINALLSVIHFAFFVYAASPRVNHTIRLTRTMVNIVEFLNRQPRIYDLKHLVFKSINDNIVERLSHNLGESVRRIESLYLIIALSTLGKEYLLSEDLLAKYFGLMRSPSTSEYTCKSPLNHFDMMTLLGYVQDRTKYASIRAFVEDHIIGRLEADAFLETRGSERTILFLDVLTCPYVRQAIKYSAGSTFGLSPQEVSDIEVANGQWFTAWGRNFKPGQELDAKRSREVY